MGHRQKGETRIRRQRTGRLIRCIQIFLLNLNKNEKHTQYPQTEKKWFNRQEWAILLGLNGSQLFILGLQLVILHVGVSLIPTGKL